MSNKIAYRRIQEADLPQLLVWRNDPDVARHMYTDHTITPEEHAAWFARIQQNPTASYWIILLDDLPVGLANVVDIDFDTKGATWAFYLADASTRGKGVGLFTEYCVLECTFGYWGLDVLRCEVLETNPDVCAMHESVGFARTGRLTARVTKAGRAIDAITYAMTNKEWREVHKPALEARLKSKKRDPLPLLSILESREAEEQLSTQFNSSMDAEIAEMRANPSKIL
ncbi:MAG: UDP-4-amino-4,6-dideoxy-N-acetyl-beta-L-altrosamine N-acetyltransferase [Hyphomicrobiaceae bacterium]|uniref:UDP-4-amino-4, 6-dideoxy-N-acetyl-beta-L-altrosamine N-acetyltransferase n=1 Tax=Bradyrhizobium sp. TaxID=376 RepID=UPI003D096763